MDDVLSRTASRDINVFSSSVSRNRYRRASLTLQKEHQRRESIIDREKSAFLAKDLEMRLQLSTANGNSLSTAILKNLDSGTSTYSQPPSIETWREGVGNLADFSENNSSNSDSPSTDSMSRRSSEISPTVINRRRSLTIPNSPRSRHLIKTREQYKYERSRFEEDTVSSSLKVKPYSRDKRRASDLGGTLLVTPLTPNDQTESEVSENEESRDMCNKIQDFLDRVTENTIQDKQPTPANKVEVSDLVPQRVLNQRRTSRVYDLIVPPASLAQRRRSLVTTTRRESQGSNKRRVSRSSSFDASFTDKSSELSNEEIDPNLKELVYPQTEHLILPPIYQQEPRKPQVPKWAKSFPPNKSFSANPAEQSKKKTLISDEEWNRLKYCRYLRVKPTKV